jgi:8-oxo-dGTP pyrophosphatase MutT (NUDIX family)
MKKIGLISFFIAVLSSGVSYSLLVLLRYTSGEEIVFSDQAFVLIATVSTVVVFSLFYFRRFGWGLAQRIFSSEIESLLGRQNKLKTDEARLSAQNELNEKTGIIEIFPNIEAAIPEICSLIEKSNKVSIFVQLGRDILSGKGLFYPFLKRNVDASSIRILHCGKNNPYITEKRALNRGRGVISEWHHEISSVDEYGKQLTEHLGKEVFETRVHNEGYLWRLFIFDDIGFIQPYIYSSNNAHKAPVFKMSNSEGSVLATFEDFFEFKWEENRPNVQCLQDILKPEEKIAVTALIRFSSLFVFVIPSRYVSTEEVLIQAPGGKVNPSEDYHTALEREVEEEIGIKIGVIGSGHTAYIHEGAHIGNWRLDDNLAPYCIYRRDTNETNRDNSIEWILLYQCDAHITDMEKITPKSELDSIICLSPEMLTKVVSNENDITVADIIHATDGSKIIGKNKLNPKATIVPRGMVPVISTSWHPRHEA